MPRLLLFSLFLVLLPKGNITEARNRARVDSFPGLRDIESYAGFFSVGESTENKLFFWFIPAFNDLEIAPLALWLQGGPGASSLFGVFVEHGPFVYVKGMKYGMIHRDFPWCDKISMLYIDQPAGTGFSFPGKVKSVPKNTLEASQDLFEALSQFFILFPEYRSHREFYLMGESYAGKFIPQLAALAKSQPGILPNISGVAIGNAYIDPFTQSDYSDYLFHLGLVDEKQASHMKKVATDAVNLAKKGQTRQAKKMMDLLIDGDNIELRTFFENVTGLTQYFNYILYEEPDMDDFINLLGSYTMRSKLHLGSNTHWSDGKIVLNHMYDDLMTSQRDNFGDLLNSGVKVLLYSGQLDIIVPYVFTQRFLKSLNWTGSREYLEAERAPWCMSTGETVGYVKRAKNYMEVLVRNAGHLVPTDQPHVAYEMINNFVFNTKFRKCAAPRPATKKPKY